MTRRVPIGLQLYSVRQECAKDLPGTLKRVAEMGYEGVEFAGYYDYAAEDLRKMLDDLGLVCCGTHTKLPTLLGDQLPATVEFNKTLGNPYLIVPGLPGECTADRDAWRRTAETFNEIDRRLRKFEAFTGYHNHWTEFGELDGEKPWDTFFSNTDDRVIMQVDFGNALRGGGDPVPYIEQYPGRAVTVHVKDYSAELGDDAITGGGDVDWNAAFNLCETVGNTRWYVVEHENKNDEPIDAVRRCLEALKQMGK